MSGVLSKQLLEAVNETSAGDGPLLSDVDWRAEGVTHPYLIFMTGRCGSTWLTSVLQATGFAGNPKELLNGEVARYEPPAEGLRDYFLSAVRRESSNGRFGLEVDPDRLRELETIIDWPAVFPVDAVATFFLYRRDLSAQAWSWASARVTGVWHTTDQPIEADDLPRVDAPTENDLIDEMVRLRRNEEYLIDFFDRHGHTPHFMEYESLVVEHAPTVGAMLRNLGIPEAEIRRNPPGAGELARIGYTDKDWALADFQHRHADTMTRLRRDRFGVSSDELATRLGAYSTV